LLVAVNTDASARRLDKGPGRPLNDERDRALVVAALESVSLVTWFDEDTPCELIARCRPDVYVKGGDYDIETLAETRLVRGWGGRSVAIPLLPGRSTSSLVQRIRGGD
jgi:rfaE bifunctional protein nucleotidyltransferase chain/domain